MSGNKMRFRLSWGHRSPGSRRIQESSRDTSSNKNTSAADVTFSTSCNKRGAHEHAVRLGRIFGLWTLSPSASGKRRVLFNDLGQLLFRDSSNAGLYLKNPFEAGVGTVISAGQAAACCGQSRRCHPWRPQCGTCLRLRETWRQRPGDSLAAVTNVEPMHHRCVFALRESPVSATLGAKAVNVEAHGQTLNVSSQSIVALLKWRPKLV